MLFDFETELRSREGKKELW